MVHLQAYYAECKYNRRNTEEVRNSNRKAYKHGEDSGPIYGRISFRLDVYSSSATRRTLLYILSRRRWYEQLTIVRRCLESRLIISICGTGWEVHLVGLTEVS